MQLIWRSGTRRSPEIYGLPVIKWIAVTLFVLIAPVVEATCPIGRGGYGGHYLYGLNQWETTLRCNVISHWLSHTKNYPWFSIFQQLVISKDDNVTIVWARQCPGIINFHGLMQIIRNSSANALELRLSCINPSIYATFIVEFYRWCLFRWHATARTEHAIWWLAEHIPRPWIWVCDYRTGLGVPCYKNRQILCGCVEKERHRHNADWKERSCSIQNGQTGIVRSQSLRSTGITPRHRSDAKVSDRSLIDVDPRVFATLLYSYEFVSWK